MKNMEKVCHILITNGYDNELAAKLPKLFISDYFEDEKEKISKSIDLFIDDVQSGRQVPDQNNNVKFAGIIKMQEADMNPKSTDGLFYNFKSQLTEKFFDEIRRLPLRRILENGGAYSNNNGYLNYFKPIVGMPKDYIDLCEVTLNTSCERAYIKVDDLSLLLKSKGFNNEFISIIWGEYGFGPRYPRFVPEEGVYLNYDAVMSLGKLQNISIKKAL